MQKNHFIRIAKRSAIALIIPLLGELFVRDWQWGVAGFLFAFVYFNILGIAYTAATLAFKHKGAKIAAGAIVIAVFAFVWGRLATG